jgi:tRNA(fMet)-specific endonuclease VapC
MAICYDTNFLILFVRDGTPNENVRRLVNPDKKAEYISLVSTVELKSFAVQNGWGKPRMEKMQALLDSLNVVDIHDTRILDRYVDIDAFSQRKHPTIVSPFKTPRNMGKHDIWIAATASVLGMQLVTTDADFDHLHTEFINLLRVKPEDLLR